MGTIVVEKGAMPYVSFDAQTGVTTSYSHSGFASSETSVKQNPGNSKRVRPSPAWKYPTNLHHYRTIQSKTYGRKVEANGSYLMAAASVWNPAGDGYGMSSFQIPVADVSGRLRATIKNQNINLAQSLAEYRQVSSMFLDSARDILTTFRSLRRGRGFSDFVRLLQNPNNRTERLIANRWLRYQYGLRPLISDIHGLCDSLSAKLQEGVLMTATASQSGSKEFNEVFPRGSPYTRFWHAKASCRGKAFYVIKHAGVKQLASYGITNPAALVWELIPYSFVVDWLFPVGDFLSSLDALNGTSDLVATFTHRIEWTCTATAYGGTHEYKQQIYRREALSVLPMPRLSYKPSTSVTKVLNGLALLSQLRG